MASLSSVSTQNPMTGCMTRVVQWFHDESRSTALKVSALVLGIFGLIGIGLVCGHPFLVTLAALPIGFWAHREWTALPLPSVEAPSPAVFVETPSWAAWRGIQEVVREAELQLPPPWLHILGNAFDGTSLIARDLSHSIMAYSVRLRDTGFAVKVRDAEQAGREVVIAFFPVHPSDDREARGRWSHSINGQVFSSDGGVDQARLLRQIIVEKNHPRFVLV